MSKTDGMAALNLEMPDRVPRTEYSADFHWKLLAHETDIKVDSDSSDDMKLAAQRAFYKCWNYDFIWNINVAHEALGEYYTDMGHAVFQSDGSDFHGVGDSKFKDEDDVLKFDPIGQLHSGTQKELVTFFNTKYAESRKRYDDVVNMCGTYISCMSGLIDLFGWDLLLTAAGVDPEGFGAVANRYADWMMQYYYALAECDSPVIMIHDDIVWTEGPFLHPDWYRKYIFPNYKRYFKPLIDAGKKIVYTSDGTYTQFVDDIAECGVNCFVMEPTTDMAYIADKYGKTHSFIGNADTRILLLGSKEDIYNEVKRCMDIGKKCPGFFMAVGNHIPSNTPIENALWYNECYEKLSRR